MKKDLSVIGNVKKQPLCSSVQLHLIFFLRPYRLVKLNEKKGVALHKRVTSQCTRNSERAVNLVSDNQTEIIRGQDKWLKYSTSRC